MIIYPMKTVKIVNISNHAEPITAHVSDKFISKLMGLMFKKQLNPNFGLFFKETSESRINTSIHMFFMRFDITVLWINKNFVVVDKVLAKKWRPYYAPKTPAQYTIELHSDRLKDFNIGDQLQVTNEG